MKNIVLNDVEYLRGKIHSATVDEQNVAFQNGLAVVKACIITCDGCRPSETYECYGVINEDFHEAYDDKCKVPGNKSRNLMFLAYNSNIDRITPDDFIVSVLCGDENITYTQNRHIRVIDGVPVMLNNIGTYQKTSIPDILITGFKNKRLYNVSRAEFLTPDVLDIREDSKNLGVFNATALISSDAKAELPFYDYLFFRIDSEGNIVSTVLSALTGDTITYSNPSSIENLISESKESFIKRMNSFYERLCDLQQGDKTYDLDKGTTRTRKSSDTVSE